MHNQEGMFAEQGMPEGTRERASRAMYEQPSRERAEYNYGEYNESYAEPGSRQQGGAKLRAPQQRSGRISIPMIVVLLLLIVLGVSGCLGLRLFESPLRDYTEASASHNFTVSSHPVLEIKGAKGDVHIHRGNTDQVTITAKMSGLDRAINANAIPVSYSQQGDTIAVTVSQSRDHFFAASTNLDVLAPETTSVQLDKQSGDVKIEDINGPITSHLADGHTELDNVQGRVDLESVKGDIELKNFTGQLNATTVHGHISLRDSELSGKSHLQTTEGDIEVEGSLDAQSNSSLSTDDGNIKLKLPPDAILQVSEHTSSGEYKNELAETSDNGPHPLLQLKTRKGDIRIEKQ
ncbi:hypothetical protein EPA93_34500 [Ktedonosporobacter rubrisoli]|uniref:DUF4097 domain-containing protein n=1 Tax=Ktedonosporobacter rubrisoli TaxID=2509675 RepID=A0A4P6JYK0_KTERU|nr:DUF4097 family beta strand repeat-containing protein [Ktedonosporobacter rubrisoli]QBD80807.1 hypothetical protein EPA93_34500 [Ktedonosporobacter rubrisoli]